MPFSQLPGKYYLIAPRLPTLATFRSLIFSYEILTPAALNFFVEYADGAVESLWSIDQYFEFVLVLMLSTGLSFQVRDLQPSSVVFAQVCKAVQVARPGPTRLTLLPLLRYR